MYQCHHSVRSFAAVRYGGDNHCMHYGASEIHRRWVRWERRSWRDGHARHGPWVVSQSVGTLWLVNRVDCQLGLACGCHKNAVGDLAVVADQDGGVVLRLFGR